MAVTEVLGGWLAGRLRALGVRRVYGSLLRGIPHVAVRDPAIARLLAAVDGQLLGGLGAAWDANNTLFLGSSPGQPTVTVGVASADQLAHALAEPPGVVMPAGRSLRIEALLDDPPPQAPADLPLERRRRVVVPDVPRRRTAVVIGECVARSGLAEEVLAHARRLRVGVAVTVGAIGLAWPADERFLGVVGLQSRDLELACSGCEQLLLVGMSAEEQRGLRDEWSAIDVTPEAFLGVELPGAGDRREGALVAGLAAALAMARAETGSPRHAAQMFVDLQSFVSAETTIASDGGAIGLWAVRTLAALRPAGVVVPTRVVPGFAAAVACVGALDGRSAVGVTAYPVDAATAAIVETVRSAGARCAVFAWGQDGPDLDEAAHSGVVGDALRRAVASVTPVGVSLGSTGPLIDAAGPVSAWAA